MTAPIPAVVPWRGLDGKSRLSAHLDSRVREALTAAMLGDVIEAINAAGCRVTVAVSDLSAAKAVTEHVNPTLDQPVATTIVGTPLSEAVAIALGDTPDGDVAVVAADLPYLSASALTALLTVTPHASIIIGRSRDGGTNALLLRSGARIHPTFGPRSAQAHASAARDAGHSSAFVDLPGIADDIDTAEHLDTLIRVSTAAGQSLGPRTQALRQSGALGRPATR